MTREPPVTQILSETLEQFQESTSGPSSTVPLARSALLIAKVEQPGVDVQVYERYIEQLSRTLETRIHPAAEPEAQIEAANRLLIEEEGFRGDTEQYEDPRNLLLHEVIERRAGIPITLAIIYVEVCRGAGLPMHPVGLPGHVIARLDAADEPRFIDVFNGGRLLTADGCRELVRSVYGSRTPFRDHFLDPVTPRQVLQRLLHNLKAGALRRGEEDRAERAIQMLLTLFPWDLDELRDRGMLRERLGRHQEALVDLEQYVSFRTGARDIQTISESVRSLRRHIDAEPA